MYKYERLKRKFRWILKKPGKVGLVLGGGGSRGAAHAGALKVLIENKISIDYIAATSSGALVAALFAAGVNVYDIIKLTKNTDWFTVARIHLGGPWPISGEGVEQFVNKHAGKVNIENLRVPLSIIATDYKTGGKVVMTRGNLAKAVYASSAIPGVFAPVKYDGKLLLDGMIVDNVPVDVVKQMGADYVIAVDVVPDVTVKDEPKNVKQIIERSIDIANNRQRKEMHEHADTLIVPVKENISPLDFGRAEDLVKMGEKATNKVIERIKRDLKT